MSTVCVLNTVLNVKALVGTSDCENFADGLFAALSRSHQNIPGKCIRRLAELSHKSED